MTTLPTMRMITRVEAPTPMNSSFFFLMIVDKEGEEKGSRLLDIHLKALGAEAKKRREAEENSRSFLTVLSVSDRFV
jgi:hypothetical protein